MTFAERIHEIYDRNKPKQIHPFIGSSVSTPSTGGLRIMVVGINAYVSTADEKTSPSWNAEWFRDQTYRYQRGVWRDVKALGAALTSPSYRLGSKTFQGMPSLFVTNAIKVYMPEATGKHADQLSHDDFMRHLDQWHDELDAMAEHHVLPHVIAIIGAPFWPFACASFRTGAFTHMRTKTYESCNGPCLHFLNKITLDAPGGEHELLLVRLRHPAGRARTGSPKWLLGQAELTAMAGV